MQSRPYEFDGGTVEAPKAKTRHRRRRGGRNG